MTDQVRQQFRQRTGVDPRTLFDPALAHFWQKDTKLYQAFVAYRVELITRMHRQLLAMCRRCQQQRPDLHLTLTQVVTLLMPGIREQIGVDNTQLLKLRPQYHYDVQLEDPYMLWNLGPDRYRLIGDAYRRWLPATQLAIDVNVVDRDPDPGQILVTERQHGLELFALVATCAAHADTVYFYAAYSLDTQDMPLVPYAAASAVHLTPLPDGQLRYSSTRQVYWTVDTRGYAAYLDNQPWPCLSDTHVLLPAGTHSISLRRLAANAAPTLRVDELNATLLSAAQHAGGCTLTYRGEHRCYLTLSATAPALRLDGKPWPATPLPEAPQPLYVLPAGEHRVEF